MTSAPPSARWEGKMTDLIARLAAATEPSRELDAEIAVAIEYAPHFRRDVYRAEAVFDFRVGHEWNGPRVEVWVHVPGITEPRLEISRQPPAFTSSIDAALTLVPDTARYWIVTSRAPDDRTAHALVQMDGTNGCSEFEADAATPAIAICIAALQARATRAGA